MSSTADGGSQPECWQIAASRDLFCDFGRKLETLSLSVHNTVFCCNLPLKELRSHHPSENYFTTRTNQYLEEQSILQKKHAGKFIQMIFSSMLFTIEITIMVNAILTAAITITVPARSCDSYVHSAAAQPLPHSASFWMQRLPVLSHICHCHTRSCGFLTE